MSALSEIGRVPPQWIWDGILGRAVHGRELTLALVELEPGIQLPEHSHPHEQGGIVLGGSMTFTVGGERRELGPGGTWLIPGDTPHSAEVGPEGAVVIDVFSPPREDWRELEELEPTPARLPESG
jgi:quercetin dioxygenase-like cupin family protein